MQSLKKLEKQTTCISHSMNKPNVSTDHHNLRNMDTNFNGNLPRMVSPEMFYLIITKDLDVDLD